jgi:hypothetical protein
VRNNSILETTGITLFFGNAGHNPKIFFDSNSSAITLETFDTQQNVLELEKIHEMACLSIKLAQDRYKENIDNQRISAPAFEIGDKI